MEELQLAFDAKLPNPKAFGKDALIIYDKFFDKTPVAKWVSKFPAKYSVKAGESLKDVSSFVKHIETIVKLTSQFSSRNLTIVVLGGGSVGDFGGFVASVLKRGVRLVHIPSTWLAAIDSAHGGKTALNVAGFKNQIGTFYPAHQIYLIKELLFGQPVVRAHEAYSEMIKMALLQGGDLWSLICELGEPTHEKIWSALGPAIEAKYRVVAEDPEEQSGYRHILNLGHTVGHVFESVHELPHGIAVNLGLRFAIEWSLQKKYLELDVFDQIVQSPTGQWLLSPSTEGLLADKYLLKYEKALLQDKKKVASNEVRFIYLSNIGSPLIEKVKVSEILKEMRRQAKAN